MTVPVAARVVTAKALMTVTSTMPAVSAAVSAAMATNVATTMTSTVAATMSACERRSGDRQRAGSECDSRDSNEFLDLHRGRLLDLGRATIALP